MGVNCNTNQERNVNIQQQMAMSGGKSTVPQWWKDQRHPQAHERMVGSIQFYRKKFEGGAHWESSEDQPRPGLDESLQARAPDEGQIKEWPGYDQSAARQGYVGRYGKCKQNRAAFERPEVGTASSMEIRASDDAINYVNMRETIKRETEADNKVKETRTNFEERHVQRDANKKMAVEASAKLVKERPQYVPVDFVLGNPLPKERPQWYGIKTTRPW